jgi:GNAT superfamily N-acetyltransferase
MAGDLWIRDATEADVPAILDLMALALGDGMPRDERFFRWKHIDNPFGASPMLIAGDDDGLVGLRAMMRWGFVRDGQPVEAVRPVDTATHPRYRRRGLFKRLTLAILDTLAERGVSMVFNTPNDQSRPGYLKMGWRSVGVLPIWARPGGRWMPSRGTPEPGRGTFPDIVDKRLVTRRSDAWSTWRYASIPGIHYRMHGDGDVGVVVRDRVRNGRSELTVCELVVPSRAAVPACARLLRQVVRQSSSDYSIGMASRVTREAAVLALAGFVLVPGRGPHLVAREVPGAQPPDRLFEPGGWRVQIGDLELF